MVRRWVRYELPVMVCVDVDDTEDHVEIVTVVMGTDHDDIRLSRDHTGNFLVYDEQMEPVPANIDDAAAAALSLAEHRDDWPAPDDWEEGPDVLRYPFLYTEPTNEPATDDDADDFEPLDLHSSEH